ncbi:MAG: S-methyl-5-thioribose-1-phosphate isomerase [Coriobacteriales bacterium]|jgi:methylthioribose-1-phosphate isomerase|nr:S-methyl-5-thioribose-1-phosphate isomerase [Coriobacteriales bacterium]
MDLTRIPRTVWLDTDAKDGVWGIYLIDQTRLPLRGDVLCCRTLEGIETAIKSLALRGAPALGVGAAMAVALFGVNESRDQGVEEWLAELDAAAERIGQARPTAVNLAWGARRARDFAHEVVEGGRGLAEAKQELINFARQMAEADEAANRAIGAHGAALLMPSSRVLTHCNAGSLGTAYFGTALGVIYTAFEQGKIEQVWSCETRPLNQGARLTVWELMRAGLPCALIADSMAASVMAQGMVDAILVGADRICANGDVANKIGTLGLAVLAKHYAIPFYVCAPSSTIDRGLSDGSAIPIEQRDPRELAGFTASGLIVPEDETTVQALDALSAQGNRVLGFKEGHRVEIGRKGGAYSFDGWFQTTPSHLPIYNPAFDVTPASLITSIVTEEGVHKPDRLG